MKDEEERRKIFEPIERSSEYTAFSEKNHEKNGNIAAAIEKNPVNLQKVV